MKKTTITRTLMITIVAFVILSAAVVSDVSEVSAQPSIKLKMHKDFGYSDFGNGAQGKWTAQATTSQDAIRVEFYLDDVLQAIDTESPFAWSYNTDDYALGLHTIKAVAYDTNGNTATAETQQNFVDSSNFASIFGISLAIIIIVIIIALIVVVVRKKRNTNR